MRELTKHLNILIALLAVALFTSVSQAGIAGSDHDFSGAGAGWNSNGEICQPCHTPHGADTTIDGSPLWNHTLSTATTYTTHAGTGQAVTTAIDNNSRLCLSCHDGTVALDSFGGTTGTTTIAGDALLGTDLSDDHPIGADAIWQGTYDSGAAMGSQWTGGDADMVSQNTRDLAGIMPLRPMAGGGNPAVGCTSCHEPHNRNNVDHLLWKSNAASALCLSCHVK